MKRTFGSPFRSFLLVASMAYASTGLAQPTSAASGSDTSALGPGAPSSANAPPAPNPPGPAAPALTAPSPAAPSPAPPQPAVEAPSQPATTPGPVPGTGAALQQETAPIDVPTASFAEPSSSDSSAPALPPAAPVNTGQPVAPATGTGTNAPAGTQVSVEQRSSGFGQPWDTASLAVDPRLEMPAEYVKRALTQPQGTLSLFFANYSAFLGTAQAVSWVPVFAFGITSDLEIAVSAPLRYDEGLGDWTFLDPIGDVTFKLAESADWELGIRAGVLLPVTSNAGTALRLGVPLLLRVGETVRVDATAEAQWTFEEPTSAGVRLPVGVTWQAAPWLFTGVGAAPSLGVGGRSKTSVDPFASLGLTLGARDRAQMDVTARFFVENMGAGDRDKLADGAGMTITVGFFPDIY